MIGVLLAAAMVCTVTRINIIACRQCCTNGAIEACTYVEHCPKTEEEKRIEHERKMEEMRLHTIQMKIQSDIEKQKTKQLDIEKSNK